MMKKMILAAMVFSMGVLTSSCADWRFFYNQQKQINYPSAQAKKPIKEGVSLNKIQ